MNVLLPLPDAPVISTRDPQKICTETSRMRISSCWDTCCLCEFPSVFRSGVGGSSLDFSVSDLAAGLFDFTVRDCIQRRTSEGQLVFVLEFVLLIFSSLGLAVNVDSELVSVSVSAGGRFARCPSWTSEISSRWVTEAQSSTEVPYPQLSLFIPSKYA